MIKSCKGCVAPRRYPGCHGQCVDYLIEKAEHDYLREADYEKRRTQGMLYEQRTQAVNRAYKKRRWSYE